MLPGDERKNERFSPHVGQKIPCGGPLKPVDYGFLQSIAGRKSVTPTREELALTVDLVEWGWLRAHLERDGVIVVSSDLDLAEVGVSVAADEAAIIRGWLDAGKLTKPTAAQIAAWNAVKDKKFQMLIISPYILIQEQTVQCH